MTAAKNWQSALGRSATLSQRAMFGAQYTTRGQGNYRGKADGTPSQIDIARAVGVSERQLRDATFVLKHGTPEVVDDVRSGRLPVDLAAIRTRGTEEPTGIVVGARRALDLPMCCSLLGYTYIIGAIGMVKIGHAGDLTRRLRSVQSCCPCELEVIGIARGRSFESELHKRFAADRRHGEWFVDARVKPWLAATSAAATRHGVCLRCASIKPADRPVKRSPSASKGIP